MVHVSKVTLTCQNWEGVPGLRASSGQACFIIIIITLSLLLELVESEPGPSEPQQAVRPPALNPPIHEIPNGEKQRRETYSMWLHWGKEHTARDSKSKSIFEGYTCSLG